MSNRAKYTHYAPEAVKALLAFSGAIRESTVGGTIMELVKLRASQMNGCLFCLDMHYKQARARGERELRLVHLAVWRESALFDEREKAALLWTEQLTRTDGNGIPDSAYEAVAAQFSEQELVDLTLAITSINAWNRLGIAFQPTPGAMDKASDVDRLGLH